MIYDICTGLVALCFLAVPILLVIFIVKWIRHKPKKKIGIAILLCIAGVIIFSVMGGAFMTDEQRAEMEQRKEDRISSIVEEEPKPTESQHETEEIPAESKEPTEEVKTEVEKFAESNDITVELSTNMEIVLNELNYTLSQAYNFERTDDWAEGERYKVYLDMEHICFFYCKGDTILSLRASNGDFLWQAE